MLSKVILLKGYYLWMASNKWYLLQEISGSLAKYVSQISINTATYHHSRFLLIRITWTKNLLFSHSQKLTQQIRPRFDNRQSVYHTLQHRVSRSQIIHISRSSTHRWYSTRPQRAATTDHYHRSSFACHPTRNQHSRHLQMARATSPTSLYQSISCCNHISLSTVWYTFITSS